MDTFIIKPDTFASFRQLVEYDISLCSIFQNGDSVGLSQTQIEELIKQNVLNENGQISDTASAAIKTLATADQFCRIRFAGAGNAFEYIHYYASKTEDSVSVTNREDGFLIQYPFDATEALLGITHYMGKSILKNFEFNVTLSELEAYVLLAFIDMNRQNRLSDISQNATSTLLSCNAATILQWLGKEYDDAQWFSAIIKEQLDQDFNLTSQQLSSVLNQLCQNKIIEQEGNNFKLSANTLGFANQFLITEHILSLSMGQESDNKVYQSGFTVVQAGVNDLLYIDVQDGKVELEVISSGRLMGYLNQFVNQLSETTIAVETQKSTIDIIEKTPEPKTETTHIFCTECGVELKEDQKFCHGCGAANEPESSEFKCPHCQTVFDEAVTFCTNCGQKVK